ncbi:hypothetical protein [Halospeciosus flavus]|uniref:DUF423 domain-containing protein n=1 Tax=Halospeciosus flavus TaxID=3032283 RepID=A0ABD5Z595_9EURY|nr:hypothetical protein [Halospeciosus flavus]
MSHRRSRLVAASLFAALVGIVLVAVGLYGVEARGSFTRTSTLLRLTGVWGAALCVGGSLLAAGHAAERLERYQGPLPYPIVAAMFTATVVLFVLTMVPLPRWLLHSGGLVAAFLLFAGGSVLLDGLV